MASEHTITQALLEWINSFALGKTIRTTDELTDGAIIWEVLQDIDPQYFLDELPHQDASENLLSKLQNLKYIHKTVVSYIRQQPDGLPSGLDPNPNLEIVAENNSVKESNKLLKLVLISAINSPNAGLYVETLQKLSTPTQETLKHVFEVAQYDQLDGSDVADEMKEENRDASVDLELRFEERMGKMLADRDRLTHEKKELEKTLEDMHNRLARLQENNDTLQSRLASTEDRLVNLKAGKGDLGFNAKALESRSRQQEDIIAAQEARLSAAQDEVDSLQMSVESLRVKNERYQRLQDDYDVLKTERDQFARKANAAEKYRSKLQASQDFEKENQALKNQIKDIQQQLKDADAQQRRATERDVELEEYKRVLPRIEQECSEMQSLKKQFEFNNHALTERLSSAEEQRERDDALISELRERIREIEGSPRSPSLTPSSETPRMQGTLQKDFEDIGIQESQLKSENDDLKKETESLKGPPTRPGSQIDGFSEAFGETLHQARERSTQDEEYWRLYDQYTSLLAKTAETQDSLALAKRDITDMQTLDSLSNKEKMDMINSARESNAEELAKTRAECDEAKHKIYVLEAELDSTHTLVRQTSTERNKLQEMLDTRQTVIAESRVEDDETMNEMKKLLTEIAAQESGDVSEASQKSGVELTKQVVELIEKNLERLAQRAEYIHNQNEHIKYLQERIKHFEEFAEDGISREREVELQKIIDAQSRELALMCSSWYEVQSRLMNNNVTSSRYRNGLADAQKGWLARQRNMVAGR
ncbi:putative microtubule binding protein HOOK3 [Aspergillus candidus]|uniref:Microtubule binding protein HOOK3 n=1 Tax=Aspergillus candidus TaxID=41067 RepID=A0A2I2FEZ1_ASPCN|nr:microtubule binding protein HOOK3 [Aspergillus candidus]PLB39203.1 microtubule binding protein HOOK3 [Aspergillus candidus]